MDIQPIFINGSWQTANSSQSSAIHNPATGAYLATVANCNEVDVAHAAQAARSAQRAWGKLPGAEKAHLLHQIAKNIRSSGIELARKLTSETGKPYIEAFDSIEWVAACFEYYAEVGRSARGLSIPPTAPHQVNFTIKEPFGVVGAIAPFNFPLLLMAWKVAPALAAGNTLVCKPPHQNPLSSLLMAKAFEILPPGVVNMITGDGSTTGEALIHNPEIDMIAFTGSTRIGRHIASIAGQQLKKVNLELGSIDPLIVFEDADLDVAVPGAAWARLLNAGQVCTSSKRFYIVESIAEEFTKKLVDFVRSLRVGDPMNPETDIGCLISAEARTTVHQQVEKLKAEGAELLYGGTPCEPDGLNGHFYTPTIFTNVKHGGIATTEEIFGPVINIITVKDADEAITLANDSQYGLGAVIYTKSLEYAMRAMEEIKAGSFWINDPLTDNDAAPFGGMRWSGTGRELGLEGLDAFREPKHVHLDYVMERKDFWFPYADRETPPSED